MKELGITKGEWQLDELTNGVSVSTKDVDDGGDIICDAPEYAEISMTRWRYNASLIIDAGNTAQKCGLLPSELLRQRDELKEQLELIKLATGIDSAAIKSTESNNQSSRER
jgi:hypothetical protein